MKKTAAKKIIILLTVLILVSVTSLLLGVSNIKLSDFLAFLIGKGTRINQAIIVNIRIPRIIIAIIAGGALALACVILQSITKNDLAESGVLGINAGAGGLIVVALFIFGTSVFSSFILPFLACLGAILTAISLYFFVYQKEKAINGTKLLLMGVGLNTVLSALTLVLSLKIPYDQFRIITIWLVGSIGNTSWWLVWILLIVVSVVFAYVYTKKCELNILGLSSEMAISIGVNERKEKMQLLVCAAILAGVAVAGGGNILFVGLLSVHISKIIVGENHTYLLVTSFLVGAILMVVGDTIGRTLFQPLEIPVGLIVGLIGAPGFLFLFAQKNRRKVEG